MNKNIQRENIEAILDQESNFGQIKNAIDNFYNLYSMQTGISGRMEEIKEIANYVSPNGVILTIENSAAQFLDYVSTTKFLRAIKKSIDLQLANKKTETVKILFTGAGPFAHLIMPLLCLYNPNQIKIEILEINPKSLEILEKLIFKLGYSDFFENIITVDPVQFENKGNKKYDILMVNCIHKALTLGPQVATVLNLSKYLKEEGVLIPESIKVNAILTDLTIELSTSQSNFRNMIFNIRRNVQKKIRIILGEAFELNKNSYKKYNDDFSPGKILEGETFIVPEKLKNMINIAYTTEIKLIDSIFLREQDETGIAKLHIDKEFQFIEPGQKIRFDYELGANPKIVPVVLK